MGPARDAFEAGFSPHRCSYAALPKMVHGNAIALHAPAYSIPSGEPKQLEKVAMLEHILSTNEDY